MEKHRIGAFERLDRYVVDLRESPPDVFEDLSATDWSRLGWRDVGRPYRVERWAKGRKEWEEQHGEPMPVKEGWERFNRSFHHFFITDLPQEQARARSAILSQLRTWMCTARARRCTSCCVSLSGTAFHRVEDAVWDPRGKRAMFEGLDVKRPRILFLGAAEGYEAMQLEAMYPGGEVVLVDYDEFCKTDRFGLFPEAYPFLGVDPATGHKRVWYREEMPIHYEVADIRDLKYGKEFDIVVSIGLVEHFPDEHKPLAFEFHRRFLKPGGYVIITTPRNQVRGACLLHHSLRLHELRVSRADGYAAARALCVGEWVRRAAGGLHQGAQRSHLQRARCRGRAKPRSFSRSASSSRSAGPRRFARLQSQSRRRLHQMLHLCLHLLRDCYGGRRSTLDALSNRAHDWESHDDDRHRDEEGDRDVFHPRRDIAFPGRSSYGNRWNSDRRHGCVRHAGNATRLTLGLGTCRLRLSNSRARILGCLLNLLANLLAQLVPRDTLGWRLAEA
jgi:SAM-dependent methyltransferase